ncbi:MAG: type IV pilus biogenesis/stability protein PilW [Steroidobacteraceae bacterium]
MRALVVLALLAGSLVAGDVLGQADSPPSLDDAARINARLAVEYMRRNEMQVARDKIERALQQNPRDISVQLSAGLVYEQLRDARTAEKHYRQALRIQSDSPQAQNSLGAFLCRNGNPEEGERMFLAAARNPLYRTPEVAYTNAGVCARGAGRLERADELLRMALAQRAPYAEALVQMAGVALDRQQPLQARAFLERYLSQARADAPALLLGYRIEVATGDAAAAEGFATRLRGEFPGSAEARSLDREGSGS